MTRKSFFQERSVKEIAKLDMRNAFTSKGLVQRINGLNSTEAIVIIIPITPARFRRYAKDSAEASRKAYKHGDYIGLSQPKTQTEAYACRDIPLGIRARDFSQLERMNEEEVNFIGYSFRPVQGRDRRKRKIPFIWILEGGRLFAYSEKYAQIDVDDRYTNSRRVKKEGADIICRVPSRTKKQRRYTVKLKNTATEGITERRAVAYSLKAEYENGNNVKHSTYNIRYTYEEDREGSEEFTFYPHDIAAYIAVIKKYNSNHNLTPIEMSPIALPSRKMADYYNRLCNNVLIFDNSLTSKDKLRKLHIDEKSILIGRAISKYGHDETMYWDPARDGRIKDYNWQME